ncbi:MAG: TadE family protein [Chloroflexota bacterium]
MTSVHRSIRHRALPGLVGRPDAPSRGQALVEFALVVPLFLTLTLSIIEFAFVFNAVLAVNFASRNAALLAAEGGNEAGTDCIVLRTIDEELTAPADRARVEQVEIYRSDERGERIGSATVYARDGGSTTCHYAGGLSVTVPYSLIADGYPEASRCNYLAGCQPGSPIDTVGVRIQYRHHWVTPLGRAVGPGTIEFDRANATRMEPVL